MTGELFYQLSEDGNVVLKMTGERGCAPTAGWDKVTAPVIEDTVSSAGHSVVIRHTIEYCSDSEDN